MISKETLRCVMIGILTDNELDEAIKHYQALHDLLYPHGERYHLVWFDVRTTLDTLMGMKHARSQKK